VNAINTHTVCCTADRHTWVSATTMSTKLTTTSLSTKAPLPLSETLRDLALLRASNVDLSSVLARSARHTKTKSTTTPEDAVVEASLARSYEFTKESRAAVRLLHRGSVDDQGGQVENARAKLEDLIQGLEQDDPSK
jgi:hypothetical protein